jgi:iron(III) transport system permease protein
MLLAVVALPLVVPALASLGQLRQIWSWSELGRLGGLMANTLVLTGGTLLAALPLGTILALLLFRTDLPGRFLFRYLFLFAVFIPLPVVVSVWQATLGPGSWLPFFLWQPRAGQPWAEGFIPAVWVHALVALPWVVLIVGQNLLWVESELEEEAWLAAPAWQVVWRVTVPRCWAALLLAGIWVAVGAAGEIAVTDMFVVRTFAEETYRVLSEGGEDAVAQVVLLSLPFTLLSWIMLAVIVPRLARSVPPVQRVVKPALRFPLGRWRWPAVGAVGLVALALTGLPLVTLSWRAGLSGTPLRWSLRQLGVGFFRIFLLDGPKCFWSLVWALLTAFLVTLLALLICWCLREAETGGRLFRGIVWTVLAAAWVMPGPLVGLGLRKTIQLLIAPYEDTLVADLLYYRPSPIPMMWAALIRGLPFAVAVVWPVFRLLPRELCAAARLEGASPLGRLILVLVPLSLFSLLGCFLVSFALAFTEVGASKLATTPGMDNFTLLVFDRMHYGVPQDVAALCLLLLLWLGLAAAEIAARTRAVTRRD